MLGCTWNVRFLNRNTLLPAYVGCTFKLKPGVRHSRPPNVHSPWHPVLSRTFEVIERLWACEVRVRNRLTITGAIQVPSLVALRGLASWCRRVFPFETEVHFLPPALPLSNTTMDQRWPTSLNRGILSACTQRFRTPLGNISPNGQGCHDLDLWVWINREIIV